MEMTAIPLATLAIGFEPLGFVVLYIWALVHVHVLHRKYGLDLPAQGGAILRVALTPGRIGPRA